MTLRIGATACGYVAIVNVPDGSAVALSPAEARKLADMSVGCSPGDFLPFVDVNGDPGAIRARIGDGAELAGCLRESADLAEAQTATKQ